MSAKERIVAGVMAGAMAFTMASCQIEGQEPTNVNPTSISTETTTNPDLKDVAPERLEFTKDFLNLYDKSITEVVTPQRFETAFNKIKDFVSRDQIIKYGETGETGENFSIVKHKDGSPAVALINCDSNTTILFNEMISEMIEDVPNYLEVLTDNGMVAFMANKYELDRDASFTFNKSGLVVWNFDPKDSIIPINCDPFKRSIMTEAFGIKIFNFANNDDGRYAIKCLPVLKQKFSGDCWWSLYEETGDENYKKYSFYNYGVMGVYNEMYNLDVNDEKTKAVIEVIKKENWVTPFGGSWEKIDYNLINQPVEFWLE